MTAPDGPGGPVSAERGGTDAAAAHRPPPQSLQIAVDVLCQLRLALLADLRSVTEDLLQVIDRLEAAVSSGQGAVPAHQLLVEKTSAIRARHELHEVVGFPGESLSDVHLQGRELCALAVRVLSDYREGQVVRLTGGEALEEEEKYKTIDTVRLLTDFLRYAEALPVEA